MRISLIVLIAVPFIPYTDAEAQLPTIEIGNRTRVAYGCSPRTLYGGQTIFDCLSATGTLTTLSADSIVLTAAYGESQLTVPFASMATFEVRRGERLQQWKGVGLGFLAGGCMGAAWAAIKCQGANETCDASEYVLLTSLLGAPAAALGAYLGNVWRDKWEDVPLGWVRLAAVRQPTGVGFGASVTF